MNNTSERYKALDKKSLTSKMASIAAGKPDSLAACMAERHRMLDNLLAAIHGDGGHYISEHGYVKAMADAMEKITQSD